MKNKSAHRTEILKGEGVNSHILYGNAGISQDTGTYESIDLEEPRIGSDIHVEWF